MAGRSHLEPKQQPDPDPRRARDVVGADARDIRLQHARMPPLRGPTASHRHHPRPDKRPKDPRASRVARTGATARPTAATATTIGWLESEFPGWHITVDETATWEGDLRPLWIARRPGHHPQALEIGHRTIKLINSTSNVEYSVSIGGAYGLTTIATSAANQNVERIPIAVTGAQNTSRSPMCMLLTHASFA
jgi:hypothetical protein